MLKQTSSTHSHLSKHTTSRHLDPKLDIFIHFFYTIVWVWSCDSTGSQQKWHGMTSRLIRRSFDLLKRWPGFMERKTREKRWENPRKTTWKTSENHRQNITKIWRVYQSWHTKLATNSKLVANHRHHPVPRHHRRCWGQAWSCGGCGQQIGLAHPGWSQM